MFVGIVGSAAVPATAATYVVNSNGNASDSNVGNGVGRTSGSVCTLRAAIQEANATTALDTITFAIGTGPQRITVSSSTVIIDGWTQPGFVDKPLMEIRGSSSLGDGVRIIGGTGSVLRGTLSNARGVQMRSDNNVVAYNHIAGNTYDGVLLYDGTNKDYNRQATGSNNLVYANVITKNSMNPPRPDGPGNGIGVFIGKGNRLVFNSIYDNYAYGINLANVDWDDIDLNDLFDADDGTNSKQNYSVLTYATRRTLNSLRRSTTSSFRPSGRSRPRR